MLKIYGSCFNQSVYNITKHRHLHGIWIIFKTFEKNNSTNESGKRTTHSGHSHPHRAHPLHVLRSEMGLAVLPALGQSDVERFRTHDPSVHLGHSSGRLLRGAEADEAEAFRPLPVRHDLRGIEVDIYP